MSRSLLSCGLLLAAVSIPAGPALAQEDPRALLRARLDSLTPLVDALSEEVEQERIAREAAARADVNDAVALDTIRVGLLTVVTPPGQADAAREVFSRALEGPLAKVDRSPALERRWFTYRESGMPPVALDRLSVNVMTDRWETRSARAERLREQLLRILTEDVVGGSQQARDPFPVAVWLAGLPLGEPREAVDASALYRRVATTRSRATRACIAGEVQACIDALGLRRGGPALATLYEPDELVDLARLVLEGMGLVRRVEGAFVEPCLTERVTTACERLLGGIYEDWAPIGRSGRLSLLWYAVEVGERGAWGRALERTDASVVEALETIGGRPVDELVAGWRARLIANRTGPHVRLASQSAFALLWALAFAGLAMRSTRWRLG